jgi:hypothetical protein
MTQDSIQHLDSLVGYNHLLEEIVDVVLCVWRAIHSQTFVFKSFDHERRYLRKERGRDLRVERVCERECQIKSNEGGNITFGGNMLL